MSEPVKLYDRYKDYFEFTNFAEGYPINFPLLPGYENLAGRWETSEHLFQAAGFRDRKEIVERFRNLPRASDAFSLKRQLNSEGQRLTDGKSGWHGTGSGSWEGDGSNAKKIEVMRLVVRQKILQHERLKKMLLETGEREIIEDTANDLSKPENERDNCWGNARGGKNWLGQILMDIRKEIKSTTESEETESTGEKDKEKQSLIEKNIKQIRAELTKITPEQKRKNFGDVKVWESNYRADLELSSIEQIKESKEGIMKLINELIAENTKKTSNNNGSNNSSNNQNNNNNNGQNQDEENQETNEPNEQPTQPEPSPSPSQPNPEPTQQQLNNAKDKLDQIKEDSKEEDIIKIVEQTSETVMNSGDENLKKQKEEAEKKLSKEKLRQIIRKEIKNVLAGERIKPDELTPSIKQKLDELNNNNNNNDQATRTEIFNEVGKQVLSKLITAVQQALKIQDQKELKSKVKELRAFISSKLDYKQNAYKLQKDKVEGLLTQANNQSSQSPQEGFFRPNNPLMWLSGIFVIGLVVGVGLLVVRVRRKAKERAK